LRQIKRLRRFLENGIGVHHAGLLPILKEAVEIMFSEGWIKVLFATSTFAMGVNMPARTVAFLKMRKRNRGEAYELLTSSEYLQMSGRAGRRGKDAIGTVIIYSDEAMDMPNMNELKAMLLEKGTPLESKFKITYKMMLHLLQSEHVDITDILRLSFSQYDHLLAVIYAQKRQHELAAALSASGSADFSCCTGTIADLEILEQIHALNHCIALALSADLVPGRVVTISFRNYFGEKAVIIQQCKDQKQMMQLRVVTIASNVELAEDENSGMLSKFNGQLDSGEYYEYTTIDLENVLSIINYTFKQVP
jgi:antiviral helicase SKI2